MGAQQTKRGGIIQGINVTPLVDITLVLLIIFIVTAKTVVPQAVPVELPRAASAESTQAIFAVGVDDSGGVTVDGEDCSMEDVHKRAARALEGDPELRAIIQADGAASHARVMGVLDALRTAGVERVAFGALRPQGEAEGGP
ncbi:MAG: biopolymer transporter ExbD [Myxococcota bacterium]